jgi:GDP-mannose transporter
MVYLPLPAVVSFIQILSSVVALLAMKQCGIKIDNLEWSKLKPYMLYIIAFVSAIYSNMQALAHSNVETVIVFRACTPIAVSFIEYMWMGRHLPSTRSAISLSVVAIGAVFYCMSDSEFAMKGVEAYYWVLTYFFLITFEMTYGKGLTSSVKMESVWGPVLYCNLLAVVPMGMLGYMQGDFDGLSVKLMEIPANGVLILLFSCVVGTLIGYSGWKCRGMVSAATYTLVGVVNKFFTVLLNVFLWDKHSSPAGLFAVCLCLAAGFFYQQAPKREDKRSIDNDDIPLLSSNKK